MNLRIATICDYAQIREGLLTIISASITRLYRANFPAPMEAMLALLIETSQDLVKIPQEIRVRIEDEDGGVLLTAGTVFQVESAPDADPGELLLIPSVLDLRAVALQKPGRYQIVIEIPGSDHTSVIAFRAELVNTQP